MHKKTRIVGSDGRVLLVRRYDSGIATIRGYHSQVPGWRPRVGCLVRHLPEVLQELQEVSTDLDAVERRWHDLMEQWERLDEEGEEDHALNARILALDMGLPGMHRIREMFRALQS